MVRKRHLNETKSSRHIDEENNTPVDVEPTKFFSTHLVWFCFMAHQPSYVI